MRRGGGGIPPIGVNGGSVATGQDGRARSRFSGVLRLRILLPPGMRVRSAFIDKPLTPLPGPYWLYLVLGIRPCHASTLGRSVGSNYGSFTVKVLMLPDPSLTVAYVSQTRFRWPVGLKCTRKDPQMSAMTLGSRLLSLQQPSWTT